MLCTSPVPSEEYLPKYYDSDAYISHTDSEKGIMAYLYQKVKGYALRKKVKLIARHNKGAGTLLDIGAGTGAFLEAASKKGWDVKGVEPSERAREVADDRSVDLVSSIDSLPESNYDAVTLWHVLEHMPDLERTVHDLASIVRPGGTLIVAVPNFRSYDARFYNTYWAAYDVPRHLWHFSKTSVRKLFSKDFDHVKTKPMLFDSFYVSLLSEKYKSGNRFSLKAIWIGFISNLKGLVSKEYSSHIYIFKRHH
ncbi:class I SAM-dependent methyltransferase [Aureitalea sp. L0-47]|nr:class I SAM-dependent methyltransferase [Aureitalea sp. L0-47]